MDVFTDTSIVNITERLGSIVWNTIRDIEVDDMKFSDEIIASAHVGTNSNDTYSVSYSFALKSNPDNVKVLNIFIIQNINSNDCCVVISSGENNGLKVLFKSINKFPIIGLEKYLPSIIKSTIALLS